ncbi:MAG: 5-oxoprolinase [Solirubrobacterales bacterium 70-9]|nr:MAG: 5-oxoprolinase [Solirubrobacterales bacterium 70-9]
MRLAIDTGGTFTDLLIERDDGRLTLAKAPTTPANPVDGVLAAIAAGAETLGATAVDVLAASSMLIHGTTRALNAVVTQTTARTALLVTEGHPDVLMFREGGRVDPFQFNRPFPDPYVPRSLTFEVAERIGADGGVVRPLDEAAVLALIERLEAAQVEAVAVCLLWSVVNPAHEQRLGELLAERLPDVQVSLSHLVNPSLREFRRASSTCMDASLKPIMTDYLEHLDGALRAAGFGGRLLVTTSDGGMVDAEIVAQTPLLALKSGPSMAPVAGRHYAADATGTTTAVVADAGGTTYDVSVVRRGVIPHTRETWIGGRIYGHMTGYPAVDVSSIGAGGGSVASVDAEGLLRVGPESVGSVPGPACYARGGTKPALADAAVVLGVLDAHHFLGGTMALDVDAARRALERDVASPLGLGVEDAAAAVMELATEHMAQAIGDVTIKQGIDPREAVLVAGGGASGLNALAVAKKLGFRCVVVPDSAATLSAAGALLSDLVWTASRTAVMASDRFDPEVANEALEQLASRCRTFAAAADRVEAATIDYSIEARYAHQAWEIEVPLTIERFETEEDVKEVVEAFHTQHREVFGIEDRDSTVEIVTWRARVSLAVSGQMGAVDTRPVTAPPRTRSVFYPGFGRHEAAVRLSQELVPGEPLEGPAIVEAPATTFAVDPDCAATTTAEGTLLLGTREWVADHLGANTAAAR